MLAWLFLHTCAECEKTRTRTRADGLRFVTLPAIVTFAGSGFPGSKVDFSADLYIPRRVLLAYVDNSELPAVLSRIGG